MHCMALNIPKALFRLWVEKHASDDGVKPWKLSQAALDRIGLGLADSRRDVPVSVRTLLNSTNS